jgi:toxin-antitoxin system PIN domain toxin
MLMPDVNVLVYAHRVDAPVHEAYAEWLTTLVESREAFALSALVGVGFLRIVTNARAYPEPTSLPTALAFIEELTSQPGCRVVNPAASHLADVIDLCRRVHATGPGIADAQHAAVAIAEGATWVTRDADFAKFVPHGLHWRHLALE